MSRWILYNTINGPDIQTEVWMSEEMLDIYDDYIKRINENKRRGKKIKSEDHLVLGKLLYYAKGGFKNYEGKEGDPIGPEFGICRIGHTRSLFRVYGGYEDIQKRVFYAVESQQKKKRKLSGKERDFITQVAKDLNDGNFTRSDKPR